MAISVLALLLERTVERSRLATWRIIRDHLKRTQLELAQSFEPRRSGRLPI